MTLKRVVLLIVVGTLAPTTGWSQTAISGPAYTSEPAAFTDPERRAKLAHAFPAIDELFRDFMARSHVPGVAWGIVIDGELAHSGAAGFRHLESKAPADVDTVFRIASMTKSFTAMAILSLRDEGKLNLDDPAERYIPELSGLIYPTSDSPRITIRQLLSHSEGFPEDNPWGDQQLGITDAQMTALLRRGIPFSNAPGVAYEYSNYGFALLGRIVARASGKPYNDYLKEKILTPLGMTSTTMEPAHVPAGKLAHGYRWEDDRWKEERLLPDGAFGPMGGMLTSIRDLSRYVAALLGAWPPRDGAEGGPIRRASLREMQQIARVGGASISRDANAGVQLTANGYGYGLGISQTCAFRHVVAHSGGLPGFGSQMRWLPEYGVGIIAFGNLTYTGWGRPVTAALEALARTGGLQPRAVRPSPALVEARNTVARLVERWDDAAAERIAADNLFLDVSKERRRAEIETLREQVGACVADHDRFDIVENALRGQWVMTCARGRLHVAITLAPTIPPSVQHLSVRPASAEVRPPTACGQ